MSDEIRLSDDQQHALLGHVIADEQIADIADGYGADKLYFLPNVQVVAKTLADFRAEHHRHPSPAELRSYGPLAREEIQIKDKLHAVVDRALQIRTTIAYDTIEPLLRYYAERQIMSSRMLAAADAYNASTTYPSPKHAEAVGLLHEAAMALEKVASAATGAKFRTMDERVQTERDERLSRSSKIIPTGVQFLDDVAGGGIAPKDLWTVSAPTGHGKTQLLLSIAAHAARAGHRAVFFALEAEPDELERRIKFTLLLKAFNAANPGNGRYVDAVRWRNGDPEIDRLFAPFENSVNEQIGNKVTTMYRGYGRYGIDELERDIFRVAPTTDLIIVDHLGYIDRGKGQENDEVASMVRKLRDLALLHSKPIVTAAHVRKSKAGEKRFAALMPDREDIIGSSAIIQCSTHVVMIAPVNELVQFGDGRGMDHPTFMRLGKFRHGGGRDRYTAICDYDVRTGGYGPQYAIGRLARADLDWLPEDSPPPWASGAKRLAGPIARQR